MGKRINSREELWERAAAMLPKGIPAEAIGDVEIDYEYDAVGRRCFNGYWIYLAAGFICKDMECHTIHEDTLAEIKEKMESVDVWEDDPMLTE